MTRSVAPATDRVRASKLAAVGWLLVSRSIVWFAAVGVIAIFGGEIERMLPGPDVAEALVISVLLGLATFVVRWPFDVAIARELRTLHGPDALYTEIWTLGRGVAIAAAALVAWLVLAAMGTLLVLPVLVAVVSIAFERPIGAWFGRTDQPLDDPMLERRLMRFVREVGLGNVRFVKSQNNARSSDMVDPGIKVFRGVIDVPAELVADGPSLLETRLATAIVQLRGWRGVKRTILAATQVIVVVLIVVLAERALMRLAGVGDVAEPGFVPTAVFLVAFARTIAGVVRAGYFRMRTSREIPDVLDLTRAPDAMLAVIEQDANTVDHVNPVRRLLSVRPFPNDAIERVERWRKNRRVTLLFTDIANSTELLNELGDERWYEVVSDHDHAVRSVITQCSGEEIDSAGDGFFIVFADGGMAVLAAIEMQRCIREIESAPGMALGVRMGVHVGEAIKRGREVVGREVNLAARIGASAEPGEILVSQQLRDELEGSMRFRFGAPRTAMLKGFSDDHIVHPVIWWTDGPSGE